MAIIELDHFSKGRNLFPEGPPDSPTDHLGKLIRDIQKLLVRAGFSDQVFAVGALSESVSLASAIAQITDAAVDKPYVLLVGEEEFTEDVTLKPYVFVLGHGPNVSRLIGRIVGPSSGVAGVFGMSVTADSAAPAFDVGAGEFLADDLVLTNIGVGASVRVTGGILEAGEIKVLNGKLIISGGEARFRSLIASGLQGSLVSAGICRVVYGILQGSFAGNVMDITGGKLEIVYARIKNLLGGFFKQTDGQLEFANLLSDGLTGAPVIPLNEIQHLAFSLVPTSGQFFIQFNGQTTTAIQWNDTPIAIQNALNALSNLGGAIVTGSFAAGFDIEFAGVDKEINQPQVTIPTNSLLNGVTAVVVTPTTPQEGLPAFGFGIEQRGGDILAGLHSIPLANQLLFGGTRTDLTLGL